MWGWFTWEIIAIVTTMAATPPTSMKGLRTRSRSLSTPMRTSMTASIPQYQVLMPLASAVVRLKITTQYRVSTLTEA